MCALTEERVSEDVLYSLDGTRFLARLEKLSNGL